MLAKEKPDIVSVCTQPEQRAAIVAYTAGEEHPPACGTPIALASPLSPSACYFHYLFVKLLTAEKEWT
jgi:hypothetical protein